MAARIAPQEGRVCTTCGIYKLADEFGVNPQHPPRLRSHCHGCRSKREKEKRDRDPDRATRLRRASLLRQYGLTLEQYEELATTQGLACAICGSQEAGSGHARLLVDHDHVTGHVRGLLCNNCNIGIANFRDNTDYLRAAISYLERKKDERTSEDCT